MANLSLKHIYKVYPNGTKAVNDFNIEIKDKEFIVLVGPSGCGKSTTLRMIAGLEEITTGEMKIGDVVVNGMEPKDRDIAMVFQNYALYPHMTIYENIAFGLRMRHVSNEEIDEKVKRAAETLGITEYLYKKPKEMSGGQRQRVALGRAIVREPKVMLLDEPLSNLDAKLRTQMRSEIVKLHNKLQTTFIYVTHDQIEAMTMGSRIVVMKDGFVKQIDTPKNLYRYPANKFVAGFIGTPQMNFFRATLKKKDNRVLISLLGTNNTIEASANTLMKVRDEYLNGDRVVTLGIRPEDIKPCKKGNNAIPILVSHTEELGTETLVYGEMDLENTGFNDSETRVILKDSGFKEYNLNEVYYASFNEEGIHLFDIDTEESIMPRVPLYNSYSCSIENNSLSIMGTKATLPSVFSSLNGDATLRIPPEAIIKGEAFRADIINTEAIDDKYLLTLSLNDNIIYALEDELPEGSEYSFDLDYKKLTFILNNEAFDPLNLINGINGRFILEVKKENHKRINTYSLQIGDVKIPSNDDVTTKLCQAYNGRGVFNTDFRYEWSPYDIKIADEGLTARVDAYLDYGAEKFLRLNVNDETFYISTDKEYQGEIKIMPDISKVSALEIKRSIRII